MSLELRLTSLINAIGADIKALKLGTKSTSQSAPSASFSTVETTIQSYTPVTGEVVAGSVYHFKAHLQVINAITASNIVVKVLVGATTVLTLTQALGTTARTTPGGLVVVEGMISFASSTSAEAFIRAFTSTPVIFDTGISTTAAVTTPTQPSDIKLNISTSGVTSTVIARQSFIQKVK